MALPSASRALAWAGAEKLKNWAGNIEYGTERLYPTSSLQQARDYVKSESKLKVLGTRHSFNHIADSKDCFLSLQPMNEVVTIDPAAHTVTVAGGITYGQLAPYPSLIGADSGRLLGAERLHRIEIGRPAGG